jgi:hypothetical protein
MYRPAGRDRGVGEGREREVGGVGERELGGKGAREIGSGRAGERSRTRDRADRHCLRKRSSQNKN